MPGVRLSRPTLDLRNVSRTQLACALNPHPYPFQIYADGTLAFIPYSPIGQRLCAYGRKVAVYVTGRHLVLVFGRGVKVRRHNAEPMAIPAYTLDKHIRDRLIPGPYEPVLSDTGAVTVSYVIHDCLTNS